MIPSKWALTVDSDMLVYVTLCVCISAREEGAGFPFPSKEKSSWGAVLVLNKSQIRSKKERERERGGQGERRRKKTPEDWVAHWSKPSLYLSPLSFWKQQLIFLISSFSTSRAWNEPAITPPQSPPPHPPTISPSSLSTLSPFKLTVPQPSPTPPFPFFFFGDWLFSTKAPNSHSSRSKCTLIFENTLPVSKVTWLSRKWWTKMNPFRPDV